MLSYQAIRLPHWGQRERGRTTDSSAGQRTMQTLRNDPISRPSTAGEAGNGNDVRTGDGDHSRHRVTWKSRIAAAAATLSDSAAGSMGMLTRRAAAASSSR